LTRPEDNDVRARDKDRFNHLKKNLFFIQRPILENISKNSIYSSKIIQPVCNVEVSIYIYLCPKRVVVPRLFYPGKIDCTLYCFSKADILLLENSVAIIFFYSLIPDLFL